MKVVIIYNQDNSGDAVVKDSIQTANQIATNLTSLGHQTELFELKSPKLPKFSADVLFNQAWGIGGDADSEAKVAELLEKTGIPFTGSDANTIRLTSDKTKAKKLFQSAKIPTPKFQTADYQIIIKPVDEDCSIGISQNSVFPKGILIEEYIDGRELNVTILGQVALPISEITFGPVFDDKYKIVDYQAKWATDSLEYKQSVGVCPANLPLELTAEIQDLALKTFNLVGCRDYARVDVRLRSDNVPFVLEINANPAIGATDGAVRSARTAGLAYPQFLEKIVKLAYARRH